MTTREEQLEALSLVSMQMIMFAGEARKSIMEALVCCENEEYSRAEELLEEAKKSMTKSHRMQTETVQKEASGEESIFSLLFAHAQDHLMTVKSEYELTKRLVGVFKRFDEKINKLKA